MGRPGSVLRAHDRRSRGARVAQHDQPGHLLPRRPLPPAAQPACGRPTSRRTARSISSRTPADGRTSPCSRRSPAVVATAATSCASSSRRRDAGGMAVSCWTVCLHNTRLGMAPPRSRRRATPSATRTTTTFARRTRTRAPMCGTLVADVTRATGPTSIELESPCFMGFAHEYHHEKDGVGLTPEDDFLLSLCFCPACLARARGRASTARQRGRPCGTGSSRPASADSGARWPDFPAAGLDVFRPHPEVYDYLTWRFEPVTSLVAEIAPRRRRRRPRCAHRSQGRLARRLRYGRDRQRFATALILCAYEMTARGRTPALIARPRGARPGQVPRHGISRVLPGGDGARGAGGPVGRGGRSRGRRDQLLQLRPDSRGAARLGRTPRSLALPARSDTGEPAHELRPNSVRGRRRRNPSASPTRTITCSACRRSTRKRARTIS